jgi:ribosomal protein S18 acetylase RimI-like enzyme
MSSSQILYAEEKWIPSYREALDLVAREKIYIEMIEAPPLEKVREFQMGLISKNGPVYYAVQDQQVVGWCDVFPKDNPRQKHRGGLGMGILPSFRGQGLGSQLMDAVLRHSKLFGLEKIELQVYTTNTPAISLYKKFGFVEEGLTRSYRKVDGVTFDALSMAKFL